MEEWSPAKGAVTIRGIALTMEEDLKYKTIKRLVDEGGNKARADMTLGIPYKSLTDKRSVFPYKKKGSPS